MFSIQKLQIGMLNEKWLNTRAVILYGFGMTAEKCIDMLLEDLEIPYIIDNAPEKQGRSYRGIPVKPHNRSVLKEDGFPIVVTAAAGAYQSISEKLTMEGFVENRDYCYLDLFTAEWYWYNKRQVHLVEVHTTITTQCTLKCKKCNMFMPYYKEIYMNTLAEFRQDMDALFRMTDRVFSIGILGGEPLLNHALSEMIRYLWDNYGQRIGEISIITNGTRMPDRALIQAFQCPKVKLYISDYTQTVPYGSQLDAFEKVMKQNQIRYHINRSLLWNDFGFPEHSCSFEDCRAHMMECFPVFRGINDKKLYFCHVSWSAEKCGLYQLKEQDYFDLTDVDAGDAFVRKKFLNYSLGGAEDWSLSFCKFCGGCGADNQNHVQAGVQSHQICLKSIGASSVSDSCC